MFQADRVPSRPSGGVPAPVPSPGASPREHASPPTSPRTVSRSSGPSSTRWSHVRRAEDRRADPRRQGARRPVRERRVRGRQERAGVRRGPDPDARGADQERHRSSTSTTRTEHVQIGSTVDRRGGDGKETLHDRRLRRGGPREGRISNESPVGRALLGKQEGRQGRRQGSGRRLRLHDHRASARRRRATPEASEGPDVDWADELAASVDGPQVVNDSKTPSGTVHVGSLRGPVHPRRHHAAPCAPAASPRPSSTGSTTSTRWTPRRC